MTTTWTVLDDSLDALRAAVAGLPDAVWQRPTPCRDWTVRQVLEHAAGDQLAWAASVGGGDGPAYDPFAPSGAEAGSADDLVTAAIRAAEAAWATVAPEAAGTSTPLPQGALPPEVAAAACGIDAAVHAWDIARAAGRPSPLPDGLAARLRPAAEAIVEPLRSYGVYGPVVAGPDDDGAAAALLRYLGRDPSWTA